MAVTGNKRKPAEQETTTAVNDDDSRLENESRDLKDAVEEASDYAFRWCVQLNMCANLLQEAAATTRLGGGREEEDGGGGGSASVVVVERIKALEARMRSMEEKVYATCASMRAVAFACNDHLAHVLSRENLISGTHAPSPSLRYFTQGAPFDADACVETERRRMLLYGSGRKQRHGSVPKSQLLNDDTIYRNSLQATMSRFRMLDSHSTYRPRESRRGHQRHNANVAKQQ